MESLSNSGLAHPPRSIPGSKSSFLPPFACTTPSTEICVLVVSFIGSDLPLGGFLAVTASGRRSHQSSLLPQTEGETVLSPGEIVALQGRGGIEESGRVHHRASWVKPGAACRTPRHPRWRPAEAARNSTERRSGARTSTPRAQRAAARGIPRRSPAPTAPAR